MTGWHIGIGYNGNAPYNTEEEMWEVLKSETRDLCNKPQEIIAEARKLNAPETCERGCCHLDTYADNYANQFKTYGHPITIIESDQQVMQLASAADDIKLAVRRAFVRCLLTRMHSKGIDINITVV